MVIQLTLNWLSLDSFLFSKVSSKHTIFDISTTRSSKTILLLVENNISVFSSY